MWRKLLLSSQVNRIPRDSFNEFIIQMEPLQVADFRFISALLHA